MQIDRYGPDREMIRVDARNNIDINFIDEHQGTGNIPVTTSSFFFNEDWRAISPVTGYMT